MSGRKHWRTSTSIPICRYWSTCCCTSGWIPTTSPGDGSATLASGCVCEAFASILCCHIGFGCGFSANHFEVLSRNSLFCSSVRSGDLGLLKSRRCHLGDLGLLKSRAAEAHGRQARSRYPLTLSFCDWQARWRSMPGVSMVPAVNVM